MRKAEYSGRRGVVKDPLGSDSVFRDWNLCEGLDTAYGDKTVNIFRDVVQMEIGKKDVRVISHVMFGELLKDLSEDALFVIKTVLEIPAALIGGKVTHNYLSINDLRKYLHERYEWNFWRINRTVEELRKKMEQYLDL